MHQEGPFSKGMFSKGFPSRKIQSESNALVRAPRRAEACLTRDDGTARWRALKSYTTCARAKASLRRTAAMLINLQHHEPLLVTANANAKPKLHSPEVGG